MNSNLRYFIPFCLAGTASVFSQDTGPRGPSPLDPPSAVNKLETADAALAPKGAALESALAAPLRWGPVDVRPHFDYTLTYGDGIPSAPGVNQKTFINSIAPGVTFQLGPRWSLDYTPRLTYYSDEAFDDTLAHSVSLQGGAQWNDWRFGVSQSYSLTSDPSIETGQQTEQEIFSTGLSASRPLGSKMLLELTASQNLNFANEFNDSKTWSTMEWLNYQFAPRLSVAGGVGFGYDQVSVGSDMLNEQLRVRIDTRIAQKLNLSVNGGAEFRQFASGGADTLVNPVYGASIIYRPFEYTTVSLNGARTVSPSLFNNELSESTDISLAVSQRLLGLLYLTVSGGYGMADYVSTLNTTTTTRSDERLSFAASLSYAFSQRISSSVFYQYSENQSDRDQFAYSSSQVGLSVGYHF